MAKITKFRGAYRWLSNFAPVPVCLDGIEYPTTEHAYQAAKTLSPDERERIRQSPTPGQAKRAGRGITVRPGWDELKRDVMLDITRQKFTNPVYRDMLRATGGDEIEEGNTWGDIYWGVCRGKGENHLGQILMQVRGEL